MISTLRSIWIWTSAAALILAWLPVLAVIRLFDRDPTRYKTGRMFRELGVALTKVSTSWKLLISGERIADPRRPYVVVCNHQSFADIPLISNLPWEMKWLAKALLFRLPVVGWMLKMAGDIPVERGDRVKGAQSILQAARYLEQHCSVMFFPEGTRSADARVHKFSEGPFRLAIKQQLPVLPLAIDGTHDCLPKHSWEFRESQTIMLKVLPAVETRGMTADDAGALCEQVRQMIIAQLAQWRGISPDKVDALSNISIPVE